MRAGVVSELGRPPEPGEVGEPEGGDIVEILAVPLNPIDVAVGAGRFYGGHPPLPYVPGCEGVGRLESGELVWVHGGGMGVTRDGAMSERFAAPEGSTIPVPEGADPAVAGALGIAGVAGWLPVAWRAPVREGETVLVLGATGTVGLVALQGAKLLGAGRVVAAGRSDEGLERARRLGADEVVKLDGDAEALAERFAEACGGDGPSYVLDPLWGEPVVAAAKSAAKGARIVSLGQSAGPTAPLVSADVRGKALEILGYSNFLVPHDVLEREYRRLVEHAIRGDVQVDVERVPLDEVGDAWRRQADGTAQRKLVVMLS